MFSLVHAFHVSLVALLLLIPGAVSAEVRSGMLTGKERLRLEALRAKRGTAARLDVGDTSFLLLVDPGLPGAIDPATRNRDQWQLTEAGRRALAQRVADWIRATDSEVRDDAAVVVHGVQVRARTNRKGTRTKLAIKAEVSLGEGSRNRGHRGIWRLKARGALSAAESPPPYSEAPLGVREEGWVPGPSGPYWTGYRVIADEATALVAGDMEFPLDELRQYQAAVESGSLLILPEGTPSAAIVDRSWPNGVVPYEFDTSDSSGIGATQRVLVEDAIDEWNDRTLVRLVPRTNEVIFVRFTRSNRCSSGLGYPNVAGPLLIRLHPTGCPVGKIIHEIGHAVGLRHEQQREDRDAYVIVDYSNIKNDDDQWDEYELVPGSSFGPYNYRSIMHYGSGYFAIDTTLPNMTPKFPLPTSKLIMGQRSELSKGDIAAADYIVTGDRRIRENAYSELWLRRFAPESLYQRVGDVNGDGHADVVAFDDGGNVHVATSLGNGFLDRGVWARGFCLVDPCLVGDVDGDGFADVVEAQTGRVLISTGSGFVPAATRTEPAIGGFERYRLADVDGDCRDDLVASIGPGVASPNEVYIALSQGESFARKRWWGDFPGAFDEVGDVDGDGRADYVTFGPGITVHRSEGDRFGTGASWWPYATAFGADAFTLADVDGDQRADLIIEVPSLPQSNLARVKIVPSSGYEFRQSDPVYHEYDCQNEAGCEYADVDGDGLLDVVDAVSVGETVSVDHRPGEVYASLSTSYITDPMPSTRPVTAPLCPGD